MISWDELADFVERVIGKRPHTGDALPKALFSWDELADFVERVTGKRPHCGDALPKALSGLPEAYDQLQAENKRLRRSVDNIKIRSYELGQRELHDMALAALKEDNGRPTT